MARVTHVCDCIHGKVIKEVLQPSCKVALCHFYSFKQDYFHVSAQKNETLYTNT